MSNKATKEFKTDLRRLLFMLQLCKITIDTINYNEETPSQMVAMGQNITKAIDKLLDRCNRASPEAWGNVRDELENGEHTQNLLLLLDLVTDVEDLTPLINHIQTNKVYVENR